MDHLKIGDIVRVIFEPYSSPRYIKIINILTDGYFKGFIDDPYNCIYCDICDNQNLKHDPLYKCSDCSFNCHLSCIEKNPTLKCSCEASKFAKYLDQYLMNNSTIIFKKNNISEIPDWTINTTKLIDIYSNKDNMGYFLTGSR